MMYKKNKKPEKPLDQKNIFFKGNLIIIPCIKDVKIPNNK